MAFYGKDIDRHVFTTMGQVENLSVGNLCQEDKRGDNKRGKRKGERISIRRAFDDGATNFSGFIKDVRDSKKTKSGMKEEKVKKQKSYGMKHRLLLIMSFIIRRRHVLFFSSR